MRHTNRKNALRLLGLATPLATFVAPQDAALRFKIGNYYYGGGAYDTKKFVQGDFYTVL